MIFKIFNKIVSLFFFRKNVLLQKQEQKEIWTNYGDGIKTRILTSTSEIIKRSQELREGAVYNTILRPEPNDNEFYDLDSLFVGIDDYKIQHDILLNYQYYDYVTSFQKNNSLEDGGYPLCVNPIDNNILQKTRAVWCHQNKCWFWPFGVTLYVEEMSPFLPKIYNLMLESPHLYPNLVPEPLWGENLRKYLKQENWNILRKYTYAQSGYRCSICGGQGEKWPVECDEVWDYRLVDQLQVAVLVGLRALCPRCHRVSHLGKANVDGKYDETIKHMAYINRWSLNHAEKVAEEAFRTFNERSEKSWMIGYDNECTWNPIVENILKTLFCETAAS